MLAKLGLPTELALDLAAHALRLVDVAMVAVAEPSASDAPAPAGLFIKRVRADGASAEGPQAQTDAEGRFHPVSGPTDLTVTPGYRFRAIDGLLTNFHLPSSSLLVLTATFGGREAVMEAYRHAVREGYRFYSYGDCMLIL